MFKSQKPFVTLMQSLEMNICTVNKVRIDMLCILSI